MDVKSKFIANDTRSFKMVEGRIRQISGTRRLERKTSRMNNHDIIGG